MDFRAARCPDRREIARSLAEARARTLLLIAPVSSEDLLLQHSPLMSPIVWDLGHIAHFEEVWLLEKLETGPSDSEGLRGIYNPFENPRATRDRLGLPSPEAPLEYLARVRRAVMGRLDESISAEPDPAPGSLRFGGFVYRLVLQHEYQHNETILQTLQLKKGAPYRPLRALSVPEPAPGWRDRVGTMVRFEGGPVRVGTDDQTTAYDNERPAHEVHLQPFLIDATPVTNAQYLEFVEAGGYRRRELWSEEGWVWARGEDAGAPLYWARDGAGSWTDRTMDRREELHPDRPVCHVSYHEAEAYARFVGKRLPDELEWEAAATWDPSTDRKRTYPWGDDPPDAERANLDALTFQTAPVGSHPANVSPIGCYGMIGDVWEWTRSDFRGYPGFRSFPYREYSEVFFGADYKVLRGGSWATRPGAIRGTFRNWDFPIRRQIFSGFRCAMDGDR